ncbi:hypothetical protein EVAR_44700_1 [Eumeta japonica]|uniref:Uncharacterized protein n=1 Tax=Eumeta variegata TaxID=151549 RepID=A0A4C1XKV3_EUMVA|nr:hypothetical protein EVAR_44700_1 [Eumeta japonica]
MDPRKRNHCHLSHHPDEGLEREVEGSGSLTRAALAAAVGLMDSLINGWQRARSLINEQPSSRTGIAASVICAGNDEGGLLFLTERSHFLSLWK